ncbi:phosphatase PAP2 family protein [Chitinimonas sp. BJB300]|uniref:phosphatase PAP2 family protein n=1 Tax=Chitinimonas sp. BJB300 TaxID=1559339 RepID=UPI000C11785A|nr:phosphatase PAP2 family protein [Chitinimonas sp. BJB300]PHV12136.1 acid phosphatase [Chitinimonas sp. BJB300]TSJ90131.1 phosphatase PAP2 family protein [Chitinimonas sp. BJB300]
MGATVSRLELACMALTALLLLLVFELTPLDVWLADPYYQGGRFIGVGNWWLDVFSHHWVKRCVIFIAVIVWLRIGMSWLHTSWMLDRRRWLTVGLALLLAPTAVSVIKHTSDRHCPWDFTRYGGTLPYMSLLDSPPASAPQGQCFPAGHASTGFALFAFVLFWRGRQPRRAWLVWVAAFSTGMALGWGQQLRGAHFLSHTLWSAWVCWAMCLVLFTVLQPTRPNKAANLIPQNVPL